MSVIVFIVFIETYPQVDTSKSSGNCLQFIKSQILPFIHVNDFRHKGTDKLQTNTISGYKEQPWPQIGMHTEDTLTQ